MEQYNIPILEDFTYNIYTGNINETIPLGAFCKYLLNRYKSFARIEEMFLNNFKEQLEEYEIAGEIVLNNVYHYLSVLEPYTFEEVSDLSDFRLSGLRWFLFRTFNIADIDRKSVV